jgi:hypothetical protein
VTAFLASRRYAAAAVLAAVAAIVATAIAVQLPDPPEVLAEREGRPPAVDAGCDRNGVDVAWDSAWFATPSPAGYRVVRARVTDIGVGCRNAQLTVRLLEGDRQLAVGTGPVQGADAVITFAQPALAQAVDGVAVEIVRGRSGR